MNVQIAVSIFLFRISDAAVQLISWAAAAENRSFQLLHETVDVA